ncbi:MAG TPA: caspase family protein [Methylomirabilota bacterium]|nr:caspase family protein [Methylomirabilota bacterium]
MKKVKILGVHGLGDHRNSTWKEDWTAVLLAAFPGQHAVAGRERVQLEFTFVTYDDIFEDVDLSVWETMQAVWKLARSGAATALGRRRGVLGDVSDRIRWTAGYVVAWVEDEKFKKLTRQRVFDALVAEQPDLVLAHSLGSLVTYNAFSHPDAGRAAVAAALRRTRYVTLGSQIGNPFVMKNLTPGRIDPLPVKYWHHLFNEEDDVFTAPIKLWEANNFEQVDVPFDIDGFADHSAVEYLKHVNTVENVWRPAAEQRIDARAFGAARARRESPAVLKQRGRLQRRALLVGINQYPREEDRLEGCVNDVFLMSSALQECGFAPESIRVCLDERATARGITERLKWLLDDPRAGDERVFYYSGHGARMPEYGENMEPDRNVETLVPWDFDWSADRAIVDDQIFGLYSQLPYGTRFAMILDCCHSGGMHRQGGARVRGLNPPDDIRHRELKWDPAADMWVSRDFERLNRYFSSRADVNAAFFGSDGASTRIGRASLVRGQTEREYRQLKRRAGTPRVGPYLPLIIEACQEREFSYEYRHGVTSYGAFTYSLCLELRRRKRISFGRLVEVTAGRLEALGYIQRPQILGPRAIVNARVPWSE